MKDCKVVTSCRAKSRRWKAGIACITLGILAGCGGGGDGDGAVSTAGVRAALTSQAEGAGQIARTDPIVQSGNSATMKLAERKCAKRARTEAGDGAARKATRHSARKEACEAELQPVSQG